MKMKKSKIIFFLPLGLIFFVITGCDNKKYLNNESLPSEIESVSTPTIESVESKSQQQEILTPYKREQIRNEILAFSFEVPEAWLIEKRHASEQEISVEQMRAFLATSYVSEKSESQKNSDYTDYTVEQIQKLPDEQIKSIYFLKIPGYGPAFPMASVSAVEKISYIDWNAKQIDFYSEKGTVENYIEERKNILKKECTENPQSSTCETIWEEETIQSMKVIVEKTPFAEEKEITKENTGEQRYYFSSPDQNTFLVVKKQARGDNEFEQDFSHLLSALQFE